MKRFWVGIVVLLSVGCSKGPPAQVGGNWSGAYDITAATTNLNVQLKQDGDRLTGEYMAAQLSAQIGFDGKLKGVVNGEEIVCTLYVPDDAQKRYGYKGDMELKCILATEDNEPILKGWTIRYDGDQKRAMETLLSKAGRGE